MLAPPAAGTLTATPRHASVAPAPERSPTARRRRAGAPLGAHRLAQALIPPLISDAGLLTQTSDSSLGIRSSGCTINATRGWLIGWRTSPTPFHCRREDRWRCPRRRVCGWRRRSTAASSSATPEADLSPGASPTHAGTRVRPRSCGTSTGESTSARGAGAPGPAATSSTPARTRADRRPRAAQPEPVRRTGVGRDARRCRPRVALRPGHRPLRNLVYAAANALTVSSPAEILRRAGAVRATELDITAYWTSSSPTGIPAPRARPTCCRT